ncbi:GGDEF domain-containing protein [Sedimentibacter saalensis]|uniref:GGDEF domain-containing protein n=1 Tax=Sedimentibacter saalensis TaxID=130788 RepID=UPI002899E555|nr:GGDEF domain-containing protein [Sedimentibacter saalensis]
MNKFFKPYMYTAIVVAVFLSAFMLFNYRVEVTVLGILITVFGMVLEVVILRYSQNKAISFLAAVAIFAVFKFNPATCVVIVTLSMALEILAVKTIKRERLFNSISKLLYNWSMRAICILSAKLVSTLLQGYNPILVIVAAVSFYDLVNVGMLNVIICLYTNSKDEMTPQGIYAQLAYVYVCAVINIIMYYGYEAYGVSGILIIYMFLLPFQTSILKKAMVKEMKAYAMIDSLTKVNNKASLSVTLTDYLNNKTPFTILFMDFDKFKNINDTYGHDVGDKILVHFAGKLKRSLRKTDKLYRFGGDEFCLLIENDCDVEAVKNKINNLKNSLVYDEGIIKIPYTFSFGMYKYTGGYGITEDEVIGTVSHRMVRNKVYMQQY